MQNKKKIVIQKIFIDCINAVSKAKSNYPIKLENINK